MEHRLQTHDRAAAPVSSAPRPLLSLQGTTAPSAPRTLRVPLPASAPAPHLPDGCRKHKNAPTAETVEAKGPGGGAEAVYSNTSKVRLEDAPRSASYRYSSGFQYLEGAIRRPPSSAAQQPLLSSAEGRWVHRLSIPNIVAPRFRVNPGAGDEIFYSIECQWFTQNHGWQWSDGTGYNIPGWGG